MGRVSVTNAPSDSSVRSVCLLFLNFLLVSDMFQTLDNDRSGRDMCPKVGTVLTSDRWFDQSQLHVHN